MTELDVFITKFLPFFSTFGVAALTWNLINYYQSQKGFLKLGLNCNSVLDQNEKYVVSKTSVENTGRRPIYIVQAFLIIVNRDHNTLDEMLDFVKNEIINDDKNCDLTKIEFKEAPDYFEAIFHYIT